MVFWRYSDRFTEEEDTARAGGVGLWQTEFEPPWEYRAKRWEVATQKAPEGCPIKGNINRDGDLMADRRRRFHPLPEVQPEHREQGQEHEAGPPAEVAVQPLKQTRLDLRRAGIEEVPEHLLLRRQQPAHSRRCNATMAAIPAAMMPAQADREPERLVPDRLLQVIPGRGKFGLGHELGHVEIPCRLGMGFGDLLLDSWHSRAYQMRTPSSIAGSLIG
jgi:hypothetical protein